jgi:hypothetical protein
MHIYKKFKDINDLPSGAIETELLFFPNVVMVPLLGSVLEKIHLNYRSQYKILKLMTTPPLSNCNISKRRSN